MSDISGAPVGPGYTPPPGPGLGNLQTLVAVLQALVRGQQQLIEAIGNFFPQASSTVATTATAGTGTLPAAPSKFLAVTVDGVAYKIPLYLP
jgi:hypothetical protein